MLEWTDAPDARFLPVSLLPEYVGLCCQHIAVDKIFFYDCFEMDFIIQEKDSCRIQDLMNPIWKIKRMKYKKTRQTDG